MQTFLHPEAPKLEGTYRAHDLLAPHFSEDKPILAMIVLNTDHHAVATFVWDPAGTDSDLGGAALIETAKGESAHAVILAASQPSNRPLNDTAPDVALFMVHLAEEFAGEDIELVDLIQFRGTSTVGDRSTENWMSARATLEGAHVVSISNN